VAGEARRIVLLGAPGSGKGTQAAKLSRALSVPAISTGDMLRAAVAAGTPLGARVGDILAAGELVDDATMAEVVKDRLAQTDAASGFLLDGYPRTRSQADTLDAVLGERGLDAVVLVEVPEPELVRRALGRQRADDTEAVIKNRLQVYEENTAPLVDLYDRRGLLQRVDGDRPVDEVTAAMLATLEVTA
jgi:adenylate kinase